MCIKLLSKTLNPKAKEWKPTPKHPHPPSPPSPSLQHLLLPSPPPPAFNPATPTYHHPSPQLIDHPGFIHYNAHTHCQPFYYASVPAHHEIHFSMAVKPKFEVEKKSCPEKKTDGLRLKSREYPPTGNAFGFKRVYAPPRLRRFQRTTPPPPPPQRREWRPRISPKDGCKLSIDGGAARLPPPLPPPSDRRRFSHTENTTVMIKNIPNKLRRDFMLKFLDDYCKTYSLEYDFLYLPIDFRKMGNLGYAFVNFTSSVAALKFKKILQNFKWGIVYTEQQLFASNKICDITWARIQGKEALIERFQKSCFACDSLDFLPVVLDPPRNGSNPNPPPPVTLGLLDPPRY